MEHGFICFKTHCRMAFHLICGWRGKQRTILTHRGLMQPLGSAHKGPKGRWWEVEAADAGGSPGELG